MARGKLAAFVAFWRFLKSRDSGVSLKLLVILAVLYVLLPTDFVPDFIPFAGWMDDVGVVTLAATILANAFEKSQKKAGKTAPQSASAPAQR